MNYVEKIFNEGTDIQKFAKGYFNHSLKLLSEIDTNTIAALADGMEKSRIEI